MGYIFAATNIESITTSFYCENTGDEVADRGIGLAVCSTENNKKGSIQQSMKSQIDHINIHSFHAISEMFIQM